MKQGMKLLVAGVVAIGASSYAQAQTNPAAQPKAGCIVLKSVAEVEQEVVNERRERVKRLAPVAKIVPGNEVVWTVTASNVCDKAAERVSIDNPVPKHMHYVADTAMGPGTEISYSLDGKQYAAPDALTVREADGTSRAARADRVLAHPLGFHKSLQPGAVAFARFEPS